MSHRYTPFLPGIFCFIALVFSIPAETAIAGMHATTNRIIVKFKSGSFESPVRDKLNVQNLQGTQLSLRHLRTLANGSRVYSLGKFQSLTDVKNITFELMRRDDVEYAEPDVRRFPLFVPNDTNYSNQWYLYQSGGGINAEQAWDITPGDSNTVIAVIDSGILLHSDLVRVLQGYDFISEDPPGSAPSNFFTANDGNGRDPDPADPGDGVNADECGDGEPSASSSWHGTQLTGILVAETNNNSGIAGVDHQAWVLPVRALGKCGGYISDIADAIRWAAGLSVPGVPNNLTPSDVINLSLGAGGACSITEQQAINAAVANSTVVVVAAGNDGALISESAPANCDNVIVVTAITRQGAETCYTNVGQGADLAAPGGNSNDPPCTALPGDGIYSTSNDGVQMPGNENLQYAAGTSFSAAMVTGAVALMKSINGSLSPGTIETILKTNARPFPAGSTDGFRPCTPENCGTGILDLQAAVTAARDADFDPPPAPSSSSGDGGGGGLSWLLVLAGLSLLFKTGFISIRPLQP